MDYIIIGLLIINLILLVISLMKNINEREIITRLQTLEINTMKELQSFKDDINRSLHSDFEH